MTFNEFSSFRDFEKIVAEILTKNEFKVNDTSSHRDLGYDLDIQLQNQTGIVEIKLQRNKIARLDLVKRACQQLLYAKVKAPTKVPILIISSYVKDSFKKETKENYGIIIWDIRELFAFAFNHSDLYYQLEDILYKAFSESVGDFSIIDKNEASNIIPDFINFQKPVTEKDEIIELKGEDLCKELNEIKAGKEEFKKFEIKCIEILKYLFDTELELWKDQNQTDDSLHRFDLLCRLRPSGKNFWEELLNDFNSRYVVFEFKNYSSAIKQGQIYTTEKYLFKTALRSVSFIVAKNDADENAYKAASGALKEAGKLIIIITPKDICDMLTLKDNGNEPADLLRDKIDNILITMSR